VRPPPAAAAAGLRAKMARAPKVAQGCHPCLGDQDDTATIATIATVRAAARHVRLAPKRGRPGSAGAPGHQDARVVDEHDPMIRCDRA